MKSLPTRKLPERPDIDQLRRQAKELLDGFRSGDREAVAEVNTHYLDANAASFALHDAQLSLARAYGFDSWPKLKAFVDDVNVARLAKAVKANDLDQVRAILKIRPELLNLEGKNEQRPIHYAVYNRSSEMVRLLMQLGADAHKGIWPNRDATGAFTMASERAYDEIVAIILEEEHRRPVPPQFNDPNAWPAELIAAAGAWDEDRIIAFLEKNPSYINVPYYLMAPLHCAAARLSERLVVWLLDHGADVNLRDRNGPSPLELAGRVVKGELDPQRVAAMVSLLRSRGAELTSRAAVAHGETEWIRARHAEGKLENRLPGNQGYRGLLEIAAAHRRPDVLELLLDLGFDPDEPVRKGDSQEHQRGGPLRECAETGQTAMAEMLLARGAALTAPVAVLLGKGDRLREQHAAGKLENPIDSDDGLISLAVRHDRAEMLALLLDLGLDPDERIRVEGLEEVVYSYGGPLRDCANKGKLELAKILLDHGAKSNTGVYAASSAVGNAYGNKNWEMVKLLESHGGRLSAAETGYVRQTEIARKMLAGEIDPHLEVGTGFNTSTVAETLLWSGASGGDPEIVRMALEQVDWPRNDPRWFWILWRPTPGHEPWAEEDRELFIECFRLMLARCDPNLRAGYGQTMAHEVISRDHEDRAELLRLLLNAGARTDFRDDLLKSTPLGWACRWGRLASVKLLLQRGADPVEADAEPWAAPRAWAEKRKNQEALAMLQKHGGRDAS